ncbi:hypothetical protein PENTCL1PPCAC_30158 [Pristionchus entomophagus]|uniref:G protein-coupled receptor n=1 Tax=Pristionchus entomophagus TaxID=358040 RepID=A0AAV5ULP6_9BILA|nr:hypothetical protein PENTCL1PPCAC_30158 [Pristionchus entomophagus]
MSISTLYPAVDPLLLIICIQSYRRRIYVWFECCIPHKYRMPVSAVSTKSKFTSSVIGTRSYALSRA